MGTHGSVTQPLLQIQDFAARIVLTATRHHNSTPLPEKLHWLHVYIPSRTLRSSLDTRNRKRKHMTFALSLTLDPTFRIHSHKTLDTIQLIF